MQSNPKLRSNDPIDCQIKTFHSAFLKRIFGVQAVNSPYSFDEILISRTP